MTGETSQVTYFTQANYLEQLDSFNLRAPRSGRLRGLRIGAKTRVRVPVPKQPDMI
jgi:hypothetical protein